MRALRKISVNGEELKLFKLPTAYYQGTDFPTPAKYAWFCNGEKRTTNFGSIHFAVQHYSDNKIKSFVHPELNGTAPIPFIRD